MLQVGREIVVSRDGHPQRSLFDARTQFAALRRPVVQQRKMGPLGHQQNAIEAEVRGFVNELLQRQTSLPPGAGITYRVQKRRKMHRQCRPNS